MSETARREIDGEIIYIYDRCLIKFIPMTVFQFINIYTYHTKFPGAAMPAYANVSPRFLSAMTYYESKLAEYRAEVEKHDN